MRSALYFELSFSERGVMFFFRLKMSVAVDVIAMATLFVATRVMAAYNADCYLTVGAIFVTLIVETTLSIARAFDLKAVTFLWCVQKQKADRLQKKIDRLSSDNKG